METVSVTEFISTYQEFVKEAIEDYREKKHISSITSRDLNTLHHHVSSYCKKKMSQKKMSQLFAQTPKLNKRTEEAQKNTEEKCIEQGECMESAETQPSAEIQPETGPSELKEFNKEVGREQDMLEEEKCIEPSQIHQSSADPFKIPDINNKAVQKPEILVEEECSELRKCMEPSQMHQSSTGPFKVIIDVDPFMKLMTEQHKQQQEIQEKMLQQQEFQEKLLQQQEFQEKMLQQQEFQEKMLHQQEFQEKMLKQQQEFQEKMLKTMLDHLSHQEQRVLQQQDSQTKLMGDFMKHSEMQVKLLSQAMNNSKTQQPVHDDHVNVDRQNTSCYKPSSIQTAYNSNSGGGSAARFPSFGHVEVANKDKQTFPLFDRYELGREFCNWFYIRLNSQNPCHGQEPLEWGPQIFWNNARFSIEHDNSDEHCTEEYIGDECVSTQLLEMTQKQKLTFTPTLDSERFRCVNSKHGLVVVAVTGVISSNDNYSGVFNQIFGLIRCPITGQYKIRSLYLRIENMTSFNSEHSVPPLQYTTEQLQEFK